MKTVMFDLDGTLLFMDMNKFVEAYFNTISMKYEDAGYERKVIIPAVEKAIKTIVLSNENIKNEDKFWGVLEEEAHINKKDALKILEDYFLNDFDKIQFTTRVNPYAKELVEFFKNNNYQIILATNPVFPQIATYKRIKWAGLDPSMFDYITTYENSFHCKPNIKYFEDLVNHFNLDVKDTIMIGNDLLEDGVASKLGIKCYITSDCLITHGLDPECFDVTSFSNLLRRIKVN